MNTATFINHLSLINHATSYLEIGVKKGRTLFDVNIPCKTGVDPCFQLNEDDIPSSIHLVSSTSDLYFANLSFETKFDIIFIDGLHTYDQVLADLNSSICHISDNSFIVIDDTLPCDIFSAYRSKAICLRDRHSISRNSLALNQWHGDIFKIFPYLSTIYRSFRYVTITDMPNPLTVLLPTKNTLDLSCFHDLHCRSTLDTRFTHLLLSNMHSYDYQYFYETLSDFINPLSLDEFLADTNLF